MGLSSSKKHDKEVVITIIGNSNAGKTALSKRIEGVKFESTVPTMGMHQVSFVRNKTLININDLGASPSIVKIWENYYSESYGIIYVIDSNDKNELENSISQLENIAKHTHVVDKPILIVLNKCDVRDSLCRGDVDKLLKDSHLENIFLTEGSCLVPNNNSLYKTLMKNFDIFLMEIVRNYSTLSHRISADKQAVEILNNSKVNKQIDAESTPAIYSRRSTLMNAVKNMESVDKTTTVSGDQLKHVVEDNISDKDQSRNESSMKQDIIEEDGLSVERPGKEESKHESLIEQIDKNEISVESQGKDKSLVEKNKSIQEDRISTELHNKDGSLTDLYTHGSWTKPNDEKSEKRVGFTEDAVIGDDQYIDEVFPSDDRCTDNNIESDTSDF